MIGAVVWTMRGIMCAVNAVSRDGIALCIYSPFGTNVRYIPLSCFFALFPHELCGPMPENLPLPDAGILCNVRRSNTTWKAIVRLRTIWKNVESFKTISKIDMEVRKHTELKSNNFCVRNRMKDLTFLILLDDFKLWECSNLWFLRLSEKNSQRTFFRVFLRVFDDVRCWLPQSLPRPLSEVKASISHGMCNLLLEELSIEITLRAGYSSSQRWWKLWWCSQLLPTWPLSEASCLEYPGKHDKLDLQHDFNQNPGLQTALYHIGP